MRTVVGNLTRFPREHVRDLMREARAQARFRGHKLGRWRPRDKSWPWVRDAHCTVCGAMARVETETTLSTPEGPLDLAGEPHVEGDAVIAACPSPLAPPRKRFPAGTV
jgi:hypothetical protein